MFVTRCLELIAIEDAPIAFVVKMARLAKFDGRIQNGVKLTVGSNSFWQLELTFLI